MILQLYIDKGYLTPERAKQLELDSFLLDILGSEKISRLITANILSIDQALELNLRQQATLNSNAIYKLIISGKIALEDALLFTARQRIVLDVLPFSDLILTDKITVDKVLQLDLKQRMILELPGIYELISKDKIAISQALSFDDNEIRILNSASMLELIDKKIINVSQALAFDKRQRRLLEVEEVRQLIISGLARETLTIDNIFPLDSNRQRILCSEHIRHLLITNKVAIDQALQLDLNQQLILESPSLFELISTERTTVSAALALTHDQQMILESDHIHSFIMRDRLTVDEAANLTSDQQRALNSPVIVRLIEQGILNIGLVLDFDDTALEVFEDAETVQRLLNGELNFDDVFGEQEGLEEQQANHLNRAQSTHTASVHRSISQSALQLTELYGESLIGGGLGCILDEVKNYLNTLDDGVKTKAAKVGFRRLTATDYSFIDPASGVSTKKILALAWLAIHDDSKRQGCLEDARALFVEACYEIQRGYNLSPTGIDLGGRDKPICAAGSFNKVLEKLQGIHPNCTVIYITPELASLKLPRVTAEETIQYVNNIQLETTEDLGRFVNLLDDMTCDGLQANHRSQTIYDHIKDKVSQRMFQEFGSLYQSKSDTGFKEMIDNGEWLEAPDIEVQQKINSSSAHQEYCKNQLFNSSLLFKSMIDEQLWEHRNDSLESREAFDSKFALVLI
ncbi:hypothetical protein ACR9PT_13160 [Piscirickettsia salmonis]|uniref:hypothetical protein n=1 Tax=Piscirickettsia salmonis TaxID=1238 RepID=UPI003EB7CC6D